MLKYRSNFNFLEDFFFISNGVQPYLSYIKFTKYRGARRCMGNPHTKALLPYKTPIQKEALPKSDRAPAHFAPRHAAAPRRPRQPRRATFSRPRPPPSPLPRHRPGRPASSKPPPAPPRAGTAPPHLRQGRPADRPVRDRPLPIDLSPVNAT